MASEQDGSLDATDDAYMPEDVRSKEFRLIKFYAIQNTAEAQAQASSTKMCPKSTQSPGTSQRCGELSHPDDPITIELEGYKLHMLEGYNATSTQAILKAVVVNGKHTLSLGGTSVETDDTVFKEYTQVQTDEHGAPKTDELGVYFYECYKFPGYYIHWNHDRSVDCERRSDVSDTRFIKWEKKPVPADSRNEGPHLQYSWLVAHGSNPPLVSPACLTFREPDDQPTIQTVNPTKFLISYDTN